MISREVWNEQEDRAEGAKFVVHLHEFQRDVLRLNPAGEDHVKQIAAALQSGADYPVIVERSMNGPSEGKYRYRVAPDPALDDQRRQLIVASLQFMGVPDADARVVVAPDFAQSATATEAEGAYYSTVGGTRSSGAFGGGFGGFGGIGGGGAFGGGGVSDYPAGGVDSVAGAVGN